MANIKSQIKRNATNAAANEKNSAAKAEVKTAMKKVETLAAEGKKEEAAAALLKATSLLDKAAQAGFMSTNSCIRKKSRLAKLVNEIK